MTRTCGTSDRRSWCTVRAAVWLLIAALTTRCTHSLLCSEMSHLSSSVGDIVKVVENRALCNRTEGLVYYSWEVFSVKNLYRQIEIHCYTENLPGSWVIVQSRTLDASNGDDSYSIPPPLLDDVTITSCEIQGCYNRYGGVTVYPTNRVSVTCSPLPDGANSSDIQVENTIYDMPTATSVTPLPSPTPSPSHVLVLGGSLTSQLPSVPPSPPAEPQRGKTQLPLQSLSVLILLPIPVVIVLTVYIVYHTSRTPTRAFIGKHFFEVKEIDWQLEPTMNPIAGEMHTPFPSLQSVCIATSPGLQTSGGEVGSTLSSLSLFEGSQPASRGSSCSEEDTPTDIVLDRPSSEDVGSSGSDGGPVESGFEPSLRAAELKTEEGHSALVDEDETTGGGVKEEELREAGSEGGNRDGAPSQLVFEMPAPALSNGGTQSSSRYHTSCSSGYVTDTSSLLSPLSLSGDQESLTLEARQRFDAGSLRNPHTEFGEVDCLRTKSQFYKDCQHNEQKFNLPGLLENEPRSHQRIGHKPRPLPCDDSVFDQPMQLEAAKSEHSEFTNTGLSDVWPENPASQIDRVLQNLPLDVEQVFGRSLDYIQPNVDSFTGSGFHSTSPRTPRGTGQNRNSDSESAASPTTHADEGEAPTATAVDCSLNCDPGYLHHYT